MTISDFKIGTTLAGLVNLEALTTPLTAPKAPYKPWNTSQAAASGLSIGKGFPSCQWTFSQLTPAQRDQLRSFCAGKSAIVYIRTMTNDTNDSYANFQAIMTWPDEEKRDPTKRHDRLEMTFSFTFLVLQS